MNEKRKIGSIIGGDKIVLIVAIIAVCALFTFLNKNFFSFQNMVNILVASSLVGMVAIGHTYLIIAKQNDLSPGSLAAFCGVLCAIMLNKGFPIVVAMIITLAAGAVVGLFNSAAESPSRSRTRHSTSWEPSGSARFRSRSG